MTEYPYGKQQPNWLLDLVTAVEDYEDRHDKGSTCLEAALFAVPDEVRIAAKAVADYKADEPEPAQPVTASVECEPAQPVTASVECATCGHPPDRPVPGQPAPYVTTGEMRESRQQDVPFGFFPPVVEARTP